MSFPMRAEEARALFWQDDNPKGVGDLYWRSTGLLASKSGPKAWRYVRVGKHSHGAAQVAWLMHYGEWPSMGVRHRNGIRSDDRVSNLRAIGLSKEVADRVAAYDSVADLV